MKGITISNQIIEVLDYLGEKFKVDPKTISSWIKELRELNYIVVEIIRNDKKEVIQRRIYINDAPYTLNNILVGITE